MRCKQVVMINDDQKRGHEKAMSERPLESFGSLTLRVMIVEERQIMNIITQTFSFRWMNVCVYRESCGYWHVQTDVCGLYINCAWQLEKIRHTSQACACTR